MRVEDSNLIEFIKDVHLTESGTYFFFEKYVITEVNEGVIYNWETAKELLDLVISYYGKNSCVGLISNRINKYSSTPTDWLKFAKNGHKLGDFAIVSYRKSSVLNSFIEDRFIKKKIHRFNDLYLAVNWMNENVVLKTKAKDN